MLNYRSIRSAYDIHRYINGYVCMCNSNIETLSFMVHEWSNGMEGSMNGRTLIHKEELKYVLGGIGNSF